MKFGEKLREQRKSHNMTQAELAAELCVTTTTLRNYESGFSYPKDRAVYSKLAEFFGVGVNYFLTEDEEFLTYASEKYGRRGLAQANALLEGAAAMFAGGELSAEDKQAFINEMQRLFLDSKERARRFTPKKYRRQPSSEPSEPESD